MSDTDTDTDTDTRDDQRSGSGSGSGSTVKLAGAWLVVGVPLAYGLYETALKAARLFTG